MYKRDNYFNDSRDPSYYDRRLQNEISEEYEPDRDPRTDEYPDGQQDHDGPSLQLPSGQDAKPSPNASRSKAELANDQNNNSKHKIDEQKLVEQLGDGDPDNPDELEIHSRLEDYRDNQDGQDNDPKSLSEKQGLSLADENPDFVLWGPAIEETLAYECAKLESIVPIECWHEVREQPVPKLLKKEYLYLKIPKRIKPLTIEFVSLEHYQINFYETYATRVVIEPAQERIVFGYFDASLFDSRMIKANAIRSKKEQERNMIRELKTENLKNIQILIDKNGREYPIDNEDIYGDDEDSDKDTMILRRKGKGDAAQRMKQRKASGKVILSEYRTNLSRTRDMDLKGGHKGTKQVVIRSMKGLDRAKEGINLKINQN